jgi:hypothetical protein
VPAPTIIYAPNHWGGAVDWANYWADALDELGYRYGGQMTHYPSPRMRATPWVGPIATHELNRPALLRTFDPDKATIKARYLMLTVPVQPDLTERSPGERPAILSAARPAHPLPAAVVDRLRKGMGRHLSQLTLDRMRNALRRYGNH